MRWILAHLRRKHHAIWVQLVYMEPYGTPTWVVWVERHGRVMEKHELARGRWRWPVLLSALRATL